MIFRKSTFEVVVSPYSNSQAPIDSDYGDNIRSLMVKGRWDKRIEKYLKSNDIRGLYLNYSRGWVGDDFEFLKTLPELELLNIINTPVESVGPVAALENLKSLSISCHWKTKVDFGKLDALEKCFLSYSKGAETVFRCDKLKYLYIDGFKLRAYDELRNLEDLEFLTIGNSNFEDVSVLKKLRKLRKLVLLNCRKIDSLTGIEALDTLEWLTIDGSRKIEEINCLSGMSNLKFLQLNNNGRIKSIKPISDLKNLEVLSFWGDTNFADGNLQPIERFEKLSLLGFANRRHYTHKIGRKWNWGDYKNQSNPILRKAQ